MVSKNSEKLRHILWHFTFLIHKLASGHTFSNRSASRSELSSTPLHSSIVQRASHAILHTTLIRSTVSDRGSNRSSTTFSFSSVSSSKTASHFSSQRCSDCSRILTKATISATTIPRTKALHVLR